MLTFFVLSERHKFKGESTDSLDMDKVSFPAVFGRVVVQVDHMVGLANGEGPVEHSGGFVIRIEEPAKG